MSGAAQKGPRFFGSLPACAQCAQRCLTPRSSRAPRACHAGPAGGTRYIFATRARASHRWCRLNSNVRQRRKHLVALQQSQRLSACAEQPRATSQSRLPANLQTPVEFSRKEQAPAPRPFASTQRCVGQWCHVAFAGYVQARGAVAARVVARCPGVLKLPQESVPRSGLQRVAGGVWRRPPRNGLLCLAPRHCLHGAALPNPSFKPSSNGVPRGPGWRYAVHFRHPGPRVTPSVPA